MTNTMNTGMEIDEELISVSPIYKTTPINKPTLGNNDSSLSAGNIHSSVFGSSPPSMPRRPTLQHQHSYAGHEEDMTEVGTVGSVPRAASGRAFLTTRHLSIEEDNNEGVSSPRNDSLEEWTSHHQNLQQTLFQSPPDTREAFRNPQPPAVEQRQEETPEERARREEEESIALAQMLMAEEAMASHRMSADFLRMNSDQFSAEDFAALQDALREEEEVEYDDSAAEGDDVDEDMSYDALLRLGDALGDVKADRWARIAHKEIAKLTTFQYDPSIHADDEDTKMEDIDDSELKCLICQFTYEKGEDLRRLPCGHCFHKDCVDQWLQTKDCCAYCRQCILPEEDDKKDAQN